MESDRRKRAEERAVFLRAASLGGLNPRDVRSLRAGQPDLFCRIGGRDTYSEVTRLVHQGSAKRMGDHLAKLKRTGEAEPLGPDPYDDRAALRETLKRKEAKCYHPDCRPLGLLVWTDGVLHPPGMPSEWADAVLRETGAPGRGSLILVFDRAEDRISETIQWIKTIVSLPAEAPDPETMSELASALLSRYCPVDSAR